MSTNLGQSGANLKTLMANEKTNGIKEFIWGIHVSHHYIYLDKKKKRNQYLCELYGTLFSLNDTI